VLTINGKPSIEAQITMPAQGAWRARVAVDDQTAPDGPVEISAADGAVKWAGTAYRSGVFGGAVFAFVIGGAGGLATQLEPRFYRGATVELVLRDALSAGGERLSDSSDRAILGAVLAAWTRARGTLGECLAAICRATGATWRVLSDGSVWLGKESWPPAPLDYTEMNVDPSAGRIEIWTEVPSLIPGVTLGGRRVSKVEHRIGAGVRTSAWYVEDGVPGDDIAAALPALVRHHTAHVDYLAHYVARVDTQNADGTLDLTPEDSRLPVLTRVPILYGIPGVSATVAAGSRVLVVFANGDPARPGATVWDRSSLVELSFAGGNSPVARMGDTVSPASLMATWMAAVSTALTITAPDDFGTVSSGSSQVKA
jgi:hypothetical protein